MTETTIVNIYYLRDPNTNEIRYIGRTKNELHIRLRGHITKARKNKKKTYKDNWILGLENKPIIELISQVVGWEKSYEVEQGLIKKHIEEGFRLVNLHDRGEGGLLRNITEEQKKKISKTVTKLHKEGKLTCNRKEVTLFTLDGVKIKTFRSFKECADYIGISEKHFTNSIKRDNRIKQYIIKEGKLEKTEPYCNKRKGREVSCMDIETGEITVYRTVKLAIKGLKTSPARFYPAVRTGNILKNKFKIWYNE